MKSRNIIFTKVNTAELLEQSYPTPSDNQVTVKLDVSTISSGTERANITGSKTVSWATKEQETAIFPRRLGYSSAGIVYEVGRGVTKFKPGDRVALSWSTHSEFCTVPETNVHHIDEIPSEEAALFHIATFPLAAIRKCKLEIGESAIVMGLGILGLIAVKLLKLAGAAPIVAVDPNPEKRELAIKYGADYAFDPFDEGFASEVKSVTHGGANVGIEVTGIGAGLDGILDCMARFGRVALLGCTRDSNFTIDYYRKVHGPGVTLVGAHTMARPQGSSSDGWWTEWDDMEALIKLSKLKRLSLFDMVEEIHSPVEAGEIYTRLATEKTFPVVQFDWRKLK